MKTFHFFTVLLCALTACMLVPLSASAQMSIATFSELSGATGYHGVSGVASSNPTLCGTALNLGTWSAFRWTPSSGLTYGGDLPGGAIQSFGNAISFDGSTLVGKSASTSGNEAFAWTVGNEPLALGDLPGGEFSSEALGVSADGSVVVGVGKSAEGSEAFRWTAEGGMVGLGDLPGGTYASRANAVSYDGTTIVGTSTSDAGSQAFRWTPGGGMVTLGGLPGQTIQYSEANAVSADGSVVVGVGTRDEAGSWEAFRWTAESGMVGLGDLPGGSFWSVAKGVSADGRIVVGFSYIRTATRTAFIWDEVNGMQSLMAYLATNGVDLSGWDMLESANAVSADGKIILGSGTYNGVSTNFLAFVPEPASMALLSLGGLALIRRGKD